MRILTALGVIMLWVGGYAEARPVEARSMEEYENFKQESTASITAELEELYAPREAEIERLATPLVMNEEVTIQMVRGGAISGTLRRISQTEVRIDDRSKPRMDVSEIDNLRLDAALKPPAERQALLDKEVARRREALAKTKRDELSVRLAAALIRGGFDASFFDQTVPLAGIFRPKKDLGDRTMGLKVTTDSSLPVARIDLQDTTGKPSLFVAYLGQQPVFSNLPDGYAVGMETPDWSHQSFQILRDDLKRGALRLRVFRHNVGAWWLESGNTTGRDAKQEPFATCMECFGSGQVTPPGQPVNRCHNCRGSGRTEGERAIIGVVAAFQYMDNQEAIYTPELADEMIKQGKRALAYQAGLDKQIVAMERQARAQRLQNEARQRAEEKTQLDAEQRKQAHLDALKTLRSSYEWQAPGQPMATRMLDVYICEGRFDNLNSPSQVQLGKITRQVAMFSDWQRLNSDLAPLPEAPRTRLFGAVWRLLWLTESPDGEPELYLQAAVNVDTTSRLANRLRLRLTLSCRPGTQEPKTASSALNFNPVKLAQGGVLLPLTVEEASQLQASGLALTISAQ